MHCFTGVPRAMNLSLVVSGLVSRNLISVLRLRTCCVLWMIPSYPESYKIKSPMYPKVKVRQEEEDPQEFQRIYLKDFQSPSNSPQHKDGYTYTPPRVLKSHHISTSDANISSSKAAAMVDRKVAGGNKPNNKVNKKIAEVIKPSSILPPRAVLSSPENDLMLRTKNKTKTERSESKNHKLSQNTHVKCKKSYELEKKNSSWSWK